MTINQHINSVLSENPTYPRKASEKKVKLRVVIYFRVGKEPEEPHPAIQAPMDLYTFPGVGNPNFKFSGIYASKGVPEISLKNCESKSEILESGKGDRALTRYDANFQQKYPCADLGTGQIRFHRRKHYKRHM